MIISDPHRYLFVELPHTGTTAISQELRDCYDGRKILHKHAHYSEFMRQASAAQREYFVFSGIRNPLDEAVSIYARIRSDHKHAYSVPRKWVRSQDIELFRWMRATDADFPAFFRRVYRYPYDNWSNEAHRQFDYVIRFERLEEDFAEVLRRLGIEPARPLPTVNSTATKERSFASYYTPDIIPRAVAIFGPFMRRWGYSFPEEWGPQQVPILAEAEFSLLGVARRGRAGYRRLSRPSKT
jgi:hypothetical protein